MVFRAFNEPKQIVDGLLRGEIDYTPTLRDTAHFERIMENPQVRLLPVAALNTYYLGFYTERRPFDDARLRRAVVHAIDVSRIAVFLGRGAALPARGPLPPGMKGYDASAHQAAYDQDMAKRLLAETGYPAGMKVKLLHHRDRDRWRGCLGGPQRAGPDRHHGRASGQTDVDRGCGGAQGPGGRHVSL